MSRQNDKLFKLHIPYKILIESFIASKVLIETIEYIVFYSFLLVMYCFLIYFCSFTHLVGVIKGVSCAFKLLILDLVQVKT